MKRICILLLLLALLLSLGASAWAEEGVEVEVIIADGESIVALLHPLRYRFLHPSHYMRH